MRHDSAAKIEIQRFLKSCRTCGMTKGYLHLSGQDSPVRVPCRCESAQCPNCGRQLLISPVRMVAEDTGGGAWNNGLLRAQCASCGPMYA